MTMILFIVFFFMSLCSIRTSYGRDTISPGKNLTDNGDTLVSSDESFELGFFSPSNSSGYRYFGIWFKKTVLVRTYVWVANRDSPVKDLAGVLSITSTGNLVITDSLNGTVIWSSNSTSTRNPTLQLLNSGNLVVKDGDSGSFAWQSFDHPCDTMLPGMKLGFDFKTGQEWVLNSWKSLQDPSVGDYSYRVDARGVPQVVLRSKGGVAYRSGPWDGERFGGDPKPQGGPVFTPFFVFNSTHVYYSFKNADTSVISRFVINQSGSIQHFSWSRMRKEWINILTIQLDQCDTYDKCGPYGICTPNIWPTCTCPPGFSPKIQQAWESRDWQDGCMKRPSLNCSDAAGFRKFTKMKLPDNSSVLINSKMMDLEQCKDACLRNCSCRGYARTEASGCVVWFTDLIDIKQYAEFGQDLYIKVAASEAESEDHSNRTAVIVSVSVVSVIFALAVAVVIYFIFRKRSSRTSKDSIAYQEEDTTRDSFRHDEEEDLDLPLFDLETIATATGNFYPENKVGEGGFGSVYKGLLSPGQEIAVKRLSKDSGQGLKEFKNEVILISKLQHRNLVRLLGCCIHREERMLVYEFMPNRSLDYYLFDQNRSTLLDWKKRFEIIIGTARGLLYLHRDSRLRIIHRDLKASNILLDIDMNPKISDFGLARTFGGDQIEANTLRIIGTYGYMAPEYAIDGHFSLKSDVFSFGVLVLEIVCGKKNRGFYHPDHDLNLLGHAWKLWTEDRALEVVDPCIEKSLTKSEALRCIKVGLLCVQHRPEDRPSMSSALLMLDSENALLPEPKQPGFYTERFFVEKDSSSTGNASSYASNEITMSMLQGR